MLAGGAQSCASGKLPKTEENKTFTNPQILHFLQKYEKKYFHFFKQRFILIGGETEPASLPEAEAMPSGIAGSRAFAAGAAASSQVQHTKEGRM